MEIDDDLTGPALRDDPHAYWHHLRSVDPVHWNTVHEAWVLTRYADVMAGFRDPRLSSERIDKRQPVLNRWMVFLDPPDHTRVRKAVDRAFTPRAMAALRPRIEAIVDDLLDPLDGDVDWIPRVAVPLPAMVIAVLLGVPDADRRRFLSWSEAIAGLVFGRGRRPDAKARADAGFEEFTAYFRDLIARRRADPTGDVLSELAGHDELSLDEIIATCTLLLFAGHSTTTNLLAGGLAELLRRPDEFERIRDDPALARPAVDELLRFEGPTGLMPRLASEDLEIDGRRIRAGQPVFLAVAAANRDPAQFSDPDRLDVARTPASHLGFGFGLHHCLGAPLARLETELVLRSLARRRSVELVGPYGWGVAFLGRSAHGVRLRLS